MTDESVQTPGPIPDSYWLIEGQLLAGEYPGAPRDDEARRKLEAILRAGVRSFIDLTEMNDPLEPCEVPAPRPARAPPLSFDTRARHVGDEVTAIDPCLIGATSVGRRRPNNTSQPSKSSARRCSPSRRRTNREWPITRLGYRSPAQVRQAFAVRPAA